MKNRHQNRSSGAKVDNWRDIAIEMAREAPDKMPWSFAAAYMADIFPGAVMEVMSLEIPLEGHRNEFRLRLTMRAADGRFRIFGTGATRLDALLSCIYDGEPIDEDPSIPF